MFDDDVKDSFPFSVSLVFSALFFSVFLFPYILEYGSTSPVAVGSLEFSTMFFNFFACLAVFAFGILVSQLLYGVVYVLLWITERIEVAVKFRKPQRIYTGKP